MKTLLHLNSSPRGNYSVSRKLSSEVVAAWKAKNPEGKVIERDLAKSHLTFVDLDWIMGAFTPPENHSEAHKKALAVSDELVAELLASDVIVIGTPMYNFAVPAALKAWIDYIVRFGKTFSYKPNGVEGRAGGRKVIVTVASGGVYAGTPLEAYDYEIPYLRHILGFIGISDVTFIQAGGTSGVAQGKISEAVNREQSRSLPISRLLGTDPLGAPPALLPDSRRCVRNRWSAASLSSKPLSSAVWPSLLFSAPCQSRCQKMTGSQHSTHRWADSRA